MLDQWTCAGGIVSTDVIVYYLLKRLLVLPLVDDTFFAPAVLINSNILFLQSRQQDSSRGLLLVTDHFYLWSLGLG